jgi:hypothetical protein
VARPAGSHFALWTSVKIVVAAVLVFLLARIAIPDLVNAHDTPLLLLAVVLGFITLGIVIWTVLSIRRSYRRLHAAGTDLIEARK